VDTLPVALSHRDQGIDSPAILGRSQWTVNLPTRPPMWESAARRRAAGRCTMAAMADVLGNFLQEFKRVAPAIVDSYFVVDRERRIVDFNRAFYALLPRQMARGLKGKKCYEVIELNICRENCIAQQCWRDNRHVRLDEISGNVIGDTEAKKFRFILSAIPITDETGQHVGALEIQRNVTDEAEVQGKYQEMLETEARERERLATQIRARTKELLETNQLLLKTQKELLAYKKGLVV
jgi:PAS domain-containing protein